MKGETKNSGTSKQPSVVTRKKGQTEALQEIWYSEGTNSQTSMGQVPESGLNKTGTPELPDVQRSL